MTATKSAKAGAQAVTTTTPALAREKRKGAAAPAPSDERVAASGIDVWDVAAHLESRGVSQRVAEQRGAASVFELAEGLIEQVPADLRRLARERHKSRRRVSVWSALMRTVTMLAGVAICVSILPKANEIVVFLTAAPGWLAGQATSSAIWFAWGRGRKADGVVAGGLTAFVMALLGVAGAAASGQWMLLVWLGIGLASPLLLVLCNAAVVALVGVAATAVCVLAWGAKNAYEWAPRELATWGLPCAIATAATATGVAFALVAWVWRRNIVRVPLATVRAIVVALAQTIFQLVVLLQIYLGVGAGAFGAVALAGLSSAILSDPLFTLVQAWARSVVQRSSSWWWGRVQIGIVGVLLAAVILVVSGAVIVVMLSDPYHIYLNEPSIIAAAMLSSAVIAGTNVLLRTGSPVAAMVFALFAEVLMMGTMYAPSDEPLGFEVMAATSAVVCALALLLAARRYGQPSTW